MHAKKMLTTYNSVHTLHLYFMNIYQRETKCCAFAVPQYNEILRKDSLKIILRSRHNNMFVFKTSISHYIQMRIACAVCEHVLVCDRFLLTVYNIVQTIQMRTHCAVCEFVQLCGHYVANTVQSDE